MKFDGVLSVVLSAYYVLISPSLPYEIARGKEDSCSMNLPCTLAYCKSILLLNFSKVEGWRDERLFRLFVAFSKLFGANCDSEKFASEFKLVLCTSTY